MILDHDSGDEDRRYVGEESCPFCGDEYRRRWITPVFEPIKIWPGFEAANFADCPPLRVEGLVTCNRAVCIEQAKRFAEAQRDPRSREERAWVQAQKQRMLGGCP